MVYSIHDYVFYCWDKRGNTKTSRPGFGAALDRWNTYNGVAHGFMAHMDVRIKKRGVRMTERLTCGYCKDTLGFLGNDCSNPQCVLQGDPQQGVMRAYKESYLKVSA